MKNIIYALKCPFTHMVHYVGQSRSGMSRPISHIAKSHSEKINKWVNELKVLGYKPEVEIIEEVESNINVRERYWVQRFINDGAVLLNENLVTPEAIDPRIKGLVTGDFDKFERIGRFVKERRKTTGLTQESFAERMGVGLAVVRKIEQGHKNINVISLLTVLNAFGCTLDVQKLDK